nr:PREDICTED: uncharacterized protein LOC105675668 [Linepithema humile]
MQRRECNTRYNSKDAIAVMQRCNAMQRRCNGSASTGLPITAGPSLSDVGSGVCPHWKIRNDKRRLLSQNLKESTVITDGPNWYVNVAARNFAATADNHATTS